MVGRIGRMLGGQAKSFRFFGHGFHGSTTALETQRFPPAMLPAECGFPGLGYLPLTTARHRSNRCRGCTERCSWSVDNRPTTIEDGVVIGTASAFAQSPGTNLHLFGLDSGLHTTRPAVFGAVLHMNNFRRFWQLKRPCSANRRRILGGR